MQTPKNVSRTSGLISAVELIYEYPTQARGTKRKFEFDSTTVDKLAEEAEEAALKQIEREQAEALKHKLPDFWLPSLTPTYTSSGPPTSLQDVKLQTTCHGGNPVHHLTYVRKTYPTNVVLTESLYLDGSS